MEDGSKPKGIYDVNLMPLIARATRTFPWFPHRDMEINSLVVKVSYNFAIRCGK
jgi:hypothetical protein